MAVNNSQYFLSFSSHQLTRISITNVMTAKQAGLLLQWVLICLRIIYNRPPSRPHQVAFYDMQGEGCLLLPISSMGALLLDLRPKAGFTFDPFGSTSLLQKVYVCVCAKFLCSLFVQLESTWASKDDKAGFVTQCHGLKLLPNMYAVFKSRLISSARICDWTQHNIIILTLWHFGWRNLARQATDGSFSSCPSSSISVAAHQV